MAFSNMPATRMYLETARLLLTLSGGVVMINKLFYWFGVILAFLFAGVSGIGAESAHAGATQTAGIVQTSPESAVYCTDGIIYLILVPDEEDGVKPVGLPAGTLCSPENLSRVPGGDPGIFTDPSEGFVVVYTDDPLWTGYIVEFCNGTTLYSITVFEGSKPRIEPDEHSRQCS